MNITGNPVRAAGTAFIWRAFQMGGVKVVFMVRLLVLAILLTPADFGLVAIATSATGFLLTLTNFGLIPAAVQAEKMEEAQYDATWSFEILRSLIVAVLTILCAPLIAAIFAEPRAVPIIQVIALRPLIESLTSIRVAALNRELVFRPLAFLKIVEAIANAVISIALAKFIGVWAIVFGIIGGTVSMVITSYILAPHRPRLLFDWRAIEPLIKFGGWLFATSLIAMVGNYGVRVVVSRQLGIDGLGLYFLAIQLAFLPGEVANEVVGSVAFPLFARLQNDIAQATRVFRALFKGLAAVIFPVCTLLIVLADSLPRDILGSNWLGTEDLIPILALTVMIGLFGDISVTVFKGVGRPHLITLLELLQSTITIIAIWTLTEKFGLMGAAMARLPAVLLSMVASAGFLRRILDQPFRTLASPLAAILVATGGCFLVSRGALILFSGAVGIFSACIFGVGISLAILWLTDRSFNLGFAHIFVMLFPQTKRLFGKAGQNNEWNDCV